MCGRGAGPPRGSSCSTQLALKDERWIAPLRLGADDADKYHAAEDPHREGTAEGLLGFVRGAVETAFPAVLRPHRRRRLGDAAP